MNLKERITSLLKEHFVDINEVENLSPEMPLISSGLLDSISILQLVDILEKEFGVAFKAHEIDREKFNSINKIEEMVAEKQV